MNIGRKTKMRDGSRRKRERKQEKVGGLVRNKQGKVAGGGGGFGGGKEAYKGGGGGGGRERESKRKWAALLETNKEKWRWWCAVWGMQKCLIGGWVRVEKENRKELSSGNGVCDMGAIIEGELRRSELSATTTN